CIVFTGGIGTGKTTLVKSLFSELDSRQVVAAQLVTTQLEADDLLRTVVASFSLPYEDASKAILLRRFEDFLRSHAEHGRRVLLVVDEAQNLPIRSLEELRMLSNFQVAERPLLQSFLLGQEEFRFTLQDPGMEQLRQRVIASCHLNPLSTEEIRPYIEHRLHVVGWQGLMPRFSEDAYVTIHQYTHGIPRRVNVFCDRLLLYGFLEEVQEFSHESITAVGNELAQDEQGGARGRTSGSGPLLRIGHVMEQRLLELEETVETLLRHPEWQDAQIERMERRLMLLEPVVRQLQRRLGSLTQQVGENRPANESSSEERL
ncbi:MAG: AAA family ATPase, partial [Candidatus Competibacteraceae bacterium]|nr:AAA family ATPase [Candidatus Competibacteraceae bacterium]